MLVQDPQININTQRISDVHDSSQKSATAPHKALSAVNKSASGNKMAQSALHSASGNKGATNFTESMGATVTAVGPSSKKDKPRVVPFQAIAAAKAENQSDH